jgi:hypothetical protein
MVKEQTLLLIGSRVWPPSVTPLALKLETFLALVSGSTSLTEFTIKKASQMRIFSDPVRIICNDPFALHLPKVLCAFGGTGLFRLYGLQASCTLPNKKSSDCVEGLCDPVWIQTRNLLIRSQMLYSIELRGRENIEYRNCITNIDVRHLN